MIEQVKEQMEALNLPIHYSDKSAEGGDKVLFIAYKPFVTFSIREAKGDGKRWFSIVRSRMAPQTGNSQSVELLSTSIGNANKKSNDKEITDAVWNVITNLEMFS